MAKFGTYLAGTTDELTAVFIDIVQEEHYRDTMPRLGRANQQSLLARKTAKAFGKTPYRTGIVQGRDGENRDSDRVLISGVTRPEALRPWMQCLHEHKTPVAGIYTPAMLSYRLLTSLNAISDATLLVTQRFDGRYRHTFYDGKSLIGSRLLRKHTGRQDESAEEFARQLDESQQYFNPSFAPATGNKLEAVVICEARTAATLGKAAAATVNFKLRFIDINDAGRKLGVDRQLVDTDSGFLFGQILRNSRPSENMAPPRDRRYFSMYRFRSYAKAACLALIGTGLLGAGLTTIQAVDFERQASSLLGAAEQAERTFELHSQNMPASTIDPFAMKGAVNAYNQLVANNISATELLQTVSSALDSFPRIQVDGIKWSTVEAAGTTESSARPAGGPVSMWLEGRVSPFDGDYTIAFDEIERFVERLSSESTVVSVTRKLMPLNTDPRDSLVGEVTTIEKLNEALFTLKLTIRTEHEKV